MIGWSSIRVRDYCYAKGWTLERVPAASPERSQEPSNG